jgi:hypothetical protein
MRILTLVLAALLATCGDDDDCADQSCTCAAAADCPSGWACGASDKTPGTNACFPRGQFPLNVSCVNETDCDPNKNLGCQDGLRICVRRCGAGMPACGANTACQGGDCMPFNTLPLGSTCVDSRLCVEGACVFGSCVITCSVGYSVLGCPDDGTYCAVLDVVPACVQPTPDCAPNTDSDCPLDRICVEVGNDLGICRRGPCSYTIDATGVYGDNCPGVGSHPGTCAPIGLGHDPACIEAADLGGGVGATCNNGRALCARGHACVGGTCRALCATVPGCASGTCGEIAPGFSACLP